MYIYIFIYIYRILYFLCIFSFFLSCLELNSSSNNRRTKLVNQRIAKLYCIAILAEKDDADVLKKLCLRLCSLLKRTSNGKLVEEQKKYLRIVHDANNDDIIVTTFADIAEKNESSLGIPSLVFAPTTDWKLFIVVALNEDPTATVGDMKLCRSIFETMSSNAWEDTVGPPLLLKLKAKPERLMPMVEIILRFVNPVAVASSKIVSEEYLPVLCKFLKSPKQNIRESSSLILQYLAQAIIAEQEEEANLTTSREGLTALIQSVVDSKGLTQPHQRYILYHTLQTIGSKIIQGRKSISVVGKNTSCTVLSELCILLGKEAKSARENRETGMAALISWLVIAKKSECGIGDKGYDTALAFICQPVIAKNGPDTVTTFGIMIQQLSPDSMKGIVVDLWNEPKFVKGLEIFVEQANKKHASSSSVAPVDGVIAIYLHLLHIAVSSDSKNLSPAIQKVLLMGSSPVEKSSFVYGQAVTNVISSNRVVGLILPQIIALFAKVASNLKLNQGIIKATSSCVRALAFCTMHPMQTGKQKSPTDSIESTIRAVLNYQPIAEALSEALFVCVNEQFVESNGDDVSICVQTVRQVAGMFSCQNISASSMAKALILMHLGTSQQSNDGDDIDNNNDDDDDDDDDDDERDILVENTSSSLQSLMEIVGDKRREYNDSIAQIVAEQAACAQVVESKSEISESITLASQSLIVSLGNIASNFSRLSDDADDDDEMQHFGFAMDLLTEGICSRFSEDLLYIINDFEALSAKDIAIYKSAKGSLFVEEDLKQNNNVTKDEGKGRRTEDEEWEYQIQKELEKKKSATSEKNRIPSVEEEKSIQVQDEKRHKIFVLIKVRYHRLMASIDSLVGSDIEIGNSCLPALSSGVLRLAILDCPAMGDVSDTKETAIRTLVSLAKCVYEIEEEYALMIAQALSTSCTKRADTKDTAVSTKLDDLYRFQVYPLPLPCEPAAIVISEMDEFQDELSGPSFAFLFPIIRAALLGPRAVPGCEGALRVLERHTLLLSGDNVDQHVKPLRAEIVTSVLGLLKFDRSKSFVDPDPYETIVACYFTEDVEDSSTPGISTAELAPLLDERGALGGGNCRVASMIALGSIATHHKKIVKNNPLIENRIWLNCYDENEAISTEARRTWKIVHDQDESEDNLLAASTMYAIPLVPLLHNNDSTIAASAAKAFAFGMKDHPKTINRNIKKLCKSYIDSCPQPGDDASIESSFGFNLPALKPIPAQPIKKKPLVPASLKKKTVKKSALQVAGIGQPKKSSKKKSKMTSAMLKPKQERTLDQTALVNQFKTGPTKVPAEKDSPEKVIIRNGVLRALAAIPLANLEMDNETLILLTSFLMAYGIADGNESLKNSSRNTLRDVIVAYGGSDGAIAFILPHLDAILKNGVADLSSLDDLPTTKVLQDIDACNRRKEGAVVALGSVALHLKGPENATKIDNSVDMLLNSLNTPNEDVQASVADALTKLMKKGNTQSRIEGILNQLLNDCLESNTISTRHGGAYGIASAVKGSGIATLKKFGIVTRLEEACSEGSSDNKEGSLFAIQLLCTRLGLLFEPYVIVLLPSLLKSFGEGNDSVRKAASKAVGVIMSKLSAHGVKLVLPAVLNAFNDSSWRTKQASINMLGSMSHLAPKQLASALPKVVPKLTEAFANTHPKVKASAEGALEEISSVIRNPEIRDISSVLLKALTDPANKTLAALEALIETEFLHAIDAPSLALIVPILHRGLRDRAATTKRYGALITGNICTMINDSRDFVPYIPTLMPDLKSSLLDPIPDVRSIAAKALGSLTRGLGEDSLPDLRPWLIEQLRMEGLSSAERSGAAQGLTEVLIASGTSVVESLMMDDILPLASHPSHCTREGVLWVLCFLPPALGQGFTVMLDDSLPALINGLSDDDEQVREVAMRAGRVLIKSHGKVHFDKILPILQSGMTDDDYRIRLSSLMLLGDLLSMIGGTTVLRTDGDTQDDIRRAERAQAQITLVLGIQTRNRVLSDVYLARSDNAGAVRHAAVQVWKTVVSVTARTLRQILQVLVSRVVSDLASGSPEKTEMAGKCLGDIVSKLGDSVLPEVIPVLRNSLYDGDINKKRGVCVGLSEVISSSTKDQILRFIDIIVKVVQDAICDDDDGVREMAASSFQNLYNLVGSKAMDEVVPALMVALEDEDDEDRSGRALNGLTGILSIRSKELLPYIIPRLVQQPLTTSHAKAISSIATVTSDTLYFHFNTIIPALLNDLAEGSSDDKSHLDAVRGCVRSVFEYADEAGVNKLISTVSGNCVNDKSEMRKESCWMLGTIVEARKLIDQMCS